MLISVVALTVVAAFESVGAILVVVMLIIPGATAFLITRNLRLMLILSVLFGVASALGGYYGATLTNTSIAGFMAVAGGVIFALTLIIRNVIDRAQALSVVSFQKQAITPDN